MSTTPLPRPPLAPRHWPAWIGIGLMALAARIPWPLQRALGRGQAIVRGLVDLRDELAREAEHAGRELLGELDAVLDGLREAFRAAAEAGHVVMTVTLSNACPAGSRFR